ncbi:MAG TPA: toll/interleukin-1 receptor domain-containing protein [Rhodanobacteraceae bacterium]|nr:toll/interleukin-1 receptor domain-containing protein [Rhodanobacteraceae bacterium]
MPESAANSGFAYRAFISYSHRDKAWGDWLHKALETYRVPSRLVGTRTAHGIIPRRLNPVFRDREELASATDLGRKVNDALGKSENLVVICSPASATSRWVNEEVLAFKRMGRADRIFCLIVDGEPNATDLPGRDSEECFCPSLRHHVDAGGALTCERTEPVAADARPGKDGKGNAKLKLVAGMLDVGFDALKQREQRRQLQRLTAITAMAVAVMAVTIVLAIFALISRHDAVIAQHKAVVAQQAAVRRQKQAEDLVGFMLGDLSDKLDQVHRLDIMQAVDDKAMAYFNSLPAADATDSALEMRVKALDKIGQVRMEANGQLAAAIATYRSAAKLAMELQRRSPGDVQHLTILSDSLNRLGNAYWQMGNLDAALKQFKTVSTLLQRAHAEKPGDDGLTFELASARNNIGHILEARGDFAGAQAEYEAALHLSGGLIARDPGNISWQSNLGNRWSSLGRLLLERGKLDQTVGAYRANQRIQASLATRDPNNHDAQENLLISDAILGRTIALYGDVDRALRYTEDAVARAKALLAFDGSSTGWQEDFALYSQQAGGLLRQLGQLEKADAADTRAVRVLQALLKKDPISSDFQQDLSQAQLESARLQLALEKPAAANDSATAALAIVEKMRARASGDRTSLLLAAQAHLLLGRASALRNDSIAARSEWTQARELIQPALRSGDDPNFLAAYAEALLRLGELDEARPIAAKLNVMGYRTPDFVALAASEHLDYPVNANFQDRVARIMQADSAQASDTSGARLAGQRH